MFQFEDDLHSKRPKIFFSFFPMESNNKQTLNRDFRFNLHFLLRLRGELRILRLIDVLFRQLQEFYSLQTISKSTANWFTVAVKSSLFLWL